VVDVECVDIVIPGADVDHSVDDSRGGSDLVGDGFAPEEVSVFTECPEASIFGADVDRVVPDGGRTMECPVGLIFPKFFTGLSVNGIKVGILAPNINYSIHHGRRAKNFVARWYFPLHLSSGGIEGIDVGITGTEKDGIVVKCGRGRNA